MAARRFLPLDQVSGYSVMVVYPVEVSFLRGLGVMVQQSLELNPLLGQDLVQDM